MSERAERPAVLERWHRIVEEQDTNALDAILADDAVFHSPIV
ncbi:MAG: nuclear transport factor 2 family protein, partial [Gammaproteobacteria bacterium]